MFQRDEIALECPEAGAQLDVVFNPHNDSEIKCEAIEGPNEEDRFKLLRDHGELMEINREGITEEMKRQLESYKRSVKIDFDITRDYMQCITTSKLPGWIITYAHCTVPQSESKQEHHTVEVAQVNDNASVSDLQESSIQVKTAEYG